MADGDVSVVFSVVGVDEPEVAKIRLSWARHRYDEGDPWPVTVTVTDAARAPVDPEILTVEFLAPGGTRVDAATIPVSAGVVTAEQILDEPGEWYVIVTVDGTYSGVETGRVPAIPLPLGA